MKARIYQFFILLLQFVCGVLVVKMEWDFVPEFLYIVLPFSVSGAILFTLYEHEIKEHERSKI